MFLHTGLTIACFHTDELCDGQNCQVRDTLYLNWEVCEFYTQYRNKSADKAVNGRRDTVKLMDKMLQLFATNAQSMNAKPSA
jgi:hypothetical protein